MVTDANLPSTLLINRADFKDAADALRDLRVGSEFEGHVKGKVIEVTESHWKIATDEVTPEGYKRVEEAEVEKDAPPIVAVINAKPK